MSYRPEDVFVTIALPDGTIQELRGFPVPQQLRKWSEKPARIEIIGSWKVEYYKELGEQDALN